MGNWPHEREGSEAGILVLLLEVASVVRKAATSCYMQLHMLHKESKRGQAAVIILCFCANLMDDND